MSDKPILARTAKGKKPQYFSDPAIDKLLAMVLTLAGELSVTRERLDTVERLLEQQGVFQQDEIDSTTHSSEALQERDKQRSDYMARILRTVQADLEQTAGKDMSASFDDLIKLVS